jgi:multiple sugar transport system ATP-binding protein
LFGERNMANVPMGRRGVGFVFQNYAIFTHMSVRQNLAYGPKMRGAPKAEIDRRVGAIAEMLQLTPLLDRKADRLSVNILQRVAIGRSAIMEPAIFLLDEPLSNVDAAFRAVMRTELKQLQRQFRQTMVYVTHDQLEAMTMADRIAVMDHGVLQQVGTPLEVYNNPVNVFVAGFIGAPGMNLLRGRPAESDRGLVIDLGPLGVTPPLPDNLAAAVRAARGDVLYGFRPEQVILSDRGLSMPVTFVERIGARTIVHLGQGESAVKAVFDNDVGLAIGQTAVVAPAQASVRVFDAATGLAMKAG